VAGNGLVISCAAPWGCGGRGGIYRAKAAAISWREAVDVMVTPGWVVEEKDTGLGALA
jgi:hypothetical protein